MSIICEQIIGDKFGGARLEEWALLESHDPYEFAGNIISDLTGQLKMRYEASLNQRIDEREELEAAKEELEEKLRAKERMEDEIAGLVQNVKGLKQKEADYLQKVNELRDDCDSKQQDILEAEKRFQSQQLETEKFRRQNQTILAERKNPF